MVTVLTSIALWWPWVYYVTTSTLGSLENAARKGEWAGVESLSFAQMSISSTYLFWEWWGKRPFLIQVLLSQLDSMHHFLFPIPPEPKFLNLPSVSTCPSLIQHTYKSIPISNTVFFSQWESQEGDRKWQWGENPKTPNLLGMVKRQKVIRVSRGSVSQPDPWPTQRNFLVPMD